MNDGSRNTTSFTPIKTNGNGDVFYNLRVVPYTALTIEERNSISCQPRHLQFYRNGWHVLAEPPYSYHGNIRELNNYLVYIYEEMSEIERLIYKDKFEAMEICSSEIEPLLNLNERKTKNSSRRKGKFLRPRGFGDK